MDKKLTSAVYAAVEKAYDHQCDIEDAAEEILEILKAERKRRQPDPTTLKNLHTLTLGKLRELAMRDCSEYSSDDLAIAWELFDRLVEGRIMEADRKQVLPFTAEKIEILWKETQARMGIGGDPVLWFARAIERAHGIPDPQHAEPDEWKLAVDHELSNMQSTADSYPSAKEAVKALIDWHVAVATDPVFRQLAEPVKVPSDDEILFTMRHLERHLKCIDGAIPTLLSTARALLARYGKPAQPAEPDSHVHTAPDDCETLHWRGQILSLNELATISAALETIGEINDDRDQLRAEDEPDLAKCAECGAELIPVRPGKWQHPDCSQSYWVAETVNKTDWNAELSSWSDEDFIRIFHECPDLADRLRKVLSEPVKMSHLNDK